MADFRRKRDRERFVSQFHDGEAREDEIKFDESSAIIRVEFFQNPPIKRPGRPSRPEFILLGEIPPLLDACTEFHGATRAVGGCPVYVSDKPGMHDFNILKKLVLPDGSILRGKFVGRPTRDCLFVDTVMDGKSLLKIWNLNKFSGVVGIFTSQGAGHWPMRDAEQQDPNSYSKSLSLSGHVSPQDIDFLKDTADERWSGDCVVYGFHVGSLTRLPREESQKVSLGTLECEIFTISPIHVGEEKLVLEIG